MTASATTAVVRSWSGIAIALGCMLVLIGCGDDGAAERRSASELAAAIADSDPAMGDAAECFAQGITDVIGADAADELAGLIRANDDGVSLGPAALRLLLFDVDQGTPDERLVELEAAVEGCDVPSQ